MRGFSLEFELESAIPCPVTRTPYPVSRIRVPRFSSLSPALPPPAHCPRPIHGLPSLSPGARGHKPKHGLAVYGQCVCSHSQCDGAGAPRRVRARSGEGFPGVGREGEEVTPHPPPCGPPSPRRRGKLFSRAAARPAIFPTFSEGRRWTATGVLTSRRGPDEGSLPPPSTTSYLPRTSTGRP